MDVEEVVVHLEVGSIMQYSIYIVILVFAGAFSYAVGIIYQRLHPKLLKTKRIWDDALAKALSTPLQYMIWWNAFLFVAISAKQDLPPELVELLNPVRKIGTVVFLFWFGIRFIYAMESNLARISFQSDSKLDKTSLRAISQILRLGLSIIAVLLVLSALGIPISGIVAFGGVSGIAVGFAAKDLLANFFGGLMIFFDRPFAIGDWIRSPDRQIEGTVENIGWRLTRIRTFDKRPLYIPNGTFSTISIENPSRMENRRIKTTIGLRYEDADKIESVIKAVEEMLKTHPEIDQRKTLFVNLVEFAPSSLEFLIYTFTKTTDWINFQAIQQDVFFKILRIITDHGAQIAYPTMQLEGIPPKSGMRVEGPN